MKTRRADHYVVVCALCRRDAQVCPRRFEGDVVARVVRAFERAGWLQVTPSRRGRPAPESAIDRGDGTWYCPACRRNLR